MLEDILPLDLDSARSHAHACVECIDLVNTITRLRAQIDEFIAELRARYDECNKKRSRFPTVSDYTSVLDIKMPLNIFNVKAGVLIVKNTKEGAGRVGEYLRPKSLDWYYMFISNRPLPSHSHKKPQTFFVFFYILRFPRFSNIMTFFVPYTPPI